MTAETDLPADAVRHLHRVRMRGVLRIVPANPDPVEFPFVAFACNERPRPCCACVRFGTSACDYGVR